MGYGRTGDERACRRAQQDTRRPRRQGARTARRDLVLAVALGDERGGGGG